MHEQQVEAAQPASFSWSEAQSVKYGGGGPHHRSQFTVDYTLLPRIDPDWLTSSSPDIATAANCPVP